MKRHRFADTCISVALFLYVALGWSLCHDGTSKGDFTALLIIGGILLPFVLLSDWIAQGRPLLPGKDEA